MWDAWMRRALALAALADGHTSPNPLVGLLFSISMGVWWGKGFTRGLVSPTLRWAPWLKPVIGRKAELLLSPSNPAVTTAAPPPVPMQF
jgi:hypothetical protein